jgi:hypothetical protein
MLRKSSSDVCETVFGNITVTLEVRLDLNTLQEITDTYDTFFSA